MPTSQFVCSLLLLATTFLGPTSASAVSLAERRLSSRATISCAVTADCSKVGYTLPKNSHYYCPKTRVCSWACNTGYTASSSICVKSIPSSSTKAAIVATSVKTTTATKTTTTTKKATTTTTKKTPTTAKKATTTTKSTTTKKATTTTKSTTTKKATTTTKSTTTKPAATSSSGIWSMVTFAPTTTSPASPSSSSTPTASSTTAAPTAPAATPSLYRTYSGSSFFSGWFWMNQTDPTHGSVSYIDQADSMTQNLTYISSSGTAIISIDRVSRLAAGTPRNSVRLSTNDVYNAGSLIIADFKHVPVGCGTWPAFWAFNNPWPQMGEIDIYEGINSRTFNQYTLHTAAGCVRNTATPMTGDTQWASADCYAYSGSSGCTVFDYDPTSYGAGFNAAGGGVFALQFAETGISIWRWPRSSIPSDVKNGAPRPKTWGTPVAAWDGSTTCGDWAGIDSVFQASDLSGACYPKYANCAAANMDPAAFAQAYFEVNYIKGTPPSPFLPWHIALNGTRPQ
ncbi:SPOSA6832_01060, partial [Sporobolomyces salmonicolor]